MTLKTYRKLKKLTQAKLAHQLGVDVCTISRVENGHQNPSPLLVEKLKALGID